jgi:hypothetical protein
MPKKKHSKKNRKVTPMSTELTPEFIQQYRQENPRVSDSTMREIINRFDAYYSRYGKRRNAIQEPPNFFTPAPPLVHHYIDELPNYLTPAPPLGHPFIDEPAKRLAHPNLYEPMFKAINPARIFGYHK